MSALPVSNTHLLAWGIDPYVPVEMLQIFTRPCEADLSQKVQFFDRPDDFLNGRWNLIAAPEGKDAPLSIRQEMTVYDAHLMTGDAIDIPQTEGVSQWLYVMDGLATIGEDKLGKGDAATDAELPPPKIRAEASTTAGSLSRSPPRSLVSCGHD